MTSKLFFITLLLSVTHAQAQQLVSQRIYPHAQQRELSGGNGISNTYYTGDIDLATCLKLAGANGTCVMSAGYTETIPPGRDGPTIRTAGTKLIGQPGSKIVGAAGRTALTVRAAGVVVDGVTIVAGEGGATMNVTGDNVIIRNTTHLNCFTYCINSGDSNNLWFDRNTEVAVAGGGASGIFYQNPGKVTTGLKITRNTATINGSGEGILVHSNTGTYVANDIDLEDNVAYINSSKACFGIEVGSFGATINPSGGKISGNRTVLGADKPCGGISLNAQDGLTVSGNTLDAAGHSWTIEAVELAQGCNRNTVSGNHVINAPPTNTGGLVDVNGGSYNKVMGNDGRNVSGIYIGYTGALNTSNNLVEGNSIALSASTSTRAAVWIQCQSSTSSHCDNNIIRNNSLTTNSSVSQCLTVEADVSSSTITNTVLEGNKCYGFTGTWYLYTNFNNGRSVTGTVLSKNSAPGAVEINDRADSVVRAENIGFRRFTRPVSQAH